MYTIEQLESILKCTYPSEVTTDTQNKRLKNIQEIQALIGEAIDSGGLLINRQKNVYTCILLKLEKKYIFNTLGKKAF